MCALWLPRYFRYSKVVIRVESTEMGGDRSINDRVTLVLTSSSKFQKNLKRKKRKQEMEDREEDDENIKEKMMKL